MHVRSLSLQVIFVASKRLGMATAFIALTMISAGPSRLAAQSPYPVGQPMPSVDAYGNSYVTQAGFNQPCDCGGGYGGPGMIAGYPGPNPMGCGGTYPPVGYDLAADASADCYGFDQRGPHYWDVRAEYVNLTRDESWASAVDFTSFGVQGPIVLSSRQLDIDDGSGFRIFGRYDICPLAVLEFGYSGIFNWKAGASFTDPNPNDPNSGNLYSLFSEFGTTPAGVQVQGGPMPESERSITQSISLEVELHTAEISYRRYWVGFVPRVTGTLLAGFRFTKLEEEFNFSTFGEGSMNYMTDANNNLAGFQTGGDIWVSLLQGLRVGSEGKVGIYNNHYVLKNIITTNPVAGSPPDLFEEFRQNQPALIAEASADVVADVLPSLSLRAGYEVLFMNSLVLAGENFNTASPYGLVGQTPRIPFLNDQGDAFMHGFHAGIEYVW